MASPLVLYQLKLPELHCLICTSCNKPPLEVQHNKRWHESNSNWPWQLWLQATYLVWGEAQRPQGAIMGIYSLQEASWRQLKDLQLSALTGKNKPGTWGGEEGESVCFVQFHMSCKIAHNWSQSASFLLYSNCICVWKQSILLCFPLCVCLTTGSGFITFITHEENLS